MLQEKGKRIGTILEYAHLLLSIRHEEDEAIVNQHGIVTDMGGELLMLIQTAPGLCRLMPGPEFSPRLYRGQNQYFEHGSPSLHREGLRQIDRLYWMAKIVELQAVLTKHPAVLDLAACRWEGLAFDIDFEALAQHYGYCTTLLDFSRSRDVAMFFATCAYDSQHKRYAPLSQGDAVLYTADLRSLILQRHGQVFPLGLEPLPRPEAQRALAVRLAPKENLNEMPWIHRTKIEITPALSRRYFDMFDGGGALFPEDEFDDYVDKLRESRTIPLGVIQFAIADSHLPQHPEGLRGAVRELHRAGYTVTDSVPSMDPETVETAGRDWQQQRSGYFARVRVRGMCDHVQTS